MRTVRNGRRVVMSGRANVPLRRAFGARLRALRVEQRISQDGLGALARLSGKFIGEVERGEKSISLDTLSRVARALGVSVGDLVGVRPNVPAQVEQVYSLLARKPLARIERATRMLRAAVGE